MNILQVCTIRTSATNLVLPLAKELRNRGHNVHCAFAEDGSGMQIEDEGFPVTLVDLSRGPSLKLMRAYGQLCNLMKAYEFDVLHVHTPVASFIGRLAGFSVGVPYVIYSIHGDPLATMNLVARHVGHWTEDLLNKRTDAIITLTESQANDMRCRIPDYSGRIVTIHCGGCGVDMGLFSPVVQADNIMRIRSVFDISDDDVVIGYVGRFDRDKGLLDLLKAYDTIAAMRTDTKLMMVGGVAPGDRNPISASDVAAFAREKGWDNQLLLIDFTEDIAQFVASMDILVLPSYREGFGLVIAEAAAVGIPSVATRTSGACEAVVDGVTGLLTPIGDPHSLAVALLSLCDDPDKRATLGENALWRARTWFDRSRVMESILEAYPTEVTP